MKDFVTFEIAKKLKEKGFKELCLAYYTNNDILYYNYSHKSGACYKDCYLSHNLMPIDSISGKFADAPTISQVLKWLREDKKISVEKNVGMHPYKGDVCWYCTIVRFSESGVREILDNFGETCNVFDSYEEAALAGIEYVLDNLI